MKKINVFPQNIKHEKTADTTPNNSERKKKIKKKFYIRETHSALKKKKSKSCNCKNSKCLKLYCECFRNKGYCGNSCNCIGC